MINRFTLIAVTTAFALTGCAKITAATSAATSAAASALTPAKPQATDFSTGPTVVTVTHLRELADDGAPPVFWPWVKPLNCTSMPASTKSGVTHVQWWVV
jgi:hypothetical protein